MHTAADSIDIAFTHPVDVRIQPPAGERNRLTTAFRLLLVIPHAILVGAPVAVASWSGWRVGVEWSSSGGGLLGLVAGVCALIAWFSILFTGEHPEGLRRLATFYLQWRVRAWAYASLLRDEYPPFGDGPYPAELVAGEPPAHRDRLSVAFRVILAIPHFVALAVLGVVWCVATVIAWLAILLTGRYPDALYAFSVGMLRWNVRVEAYMLLLHDEYPPFSLE
ncbi:MAG TPA: DUF4389 domain-containing protein [Longimicrobium sp.]|nr:DUF4389 domain-containing protein [Longimicrobium sp.]